MNKWGGFNSLITRKTDWDMVLARSFLENVLVIRGDDASATLPLNKST